MNKIYTVYTLSCLSLNITFAVRHNFLHWVLSSLVSLLCVCYAKRRVWSVFIFTKWQFGPSVSESLWGHGKYLFLTWFAWSYVVSWCFWVKSRLLFCCLTVIIVYFEDIGGVKQQDALQPAIDRVIILWIFNDTCRKSLRSHTGINNSVNSVGFNSLRLSYYCQMNRGWQIMLNPVVRRVYFCFQRFSTYLYAITKYQLSGLVVSVRPESGRSGFNPRLSHTKDYKNGTQCLSAWHSASKGLDWG